MFVWQLHSISCLLSMSILFCATYCTLSAELLHIRQNTYSQYETGRRQIPIALLIQLSEFYETSVDYLLGLTNETKPYPRSSER